MWTATDGVRVVGPADGEAGWLGAIGVRFMIDGGESRTAASRSSSTRCRRARWRRRCTSTRARTSTATCSTGRMGALLGDDVRRGGAGRPRLQAPRPVAHVLERRRRGVPDPRDHRARGLRGLLPRARPRNEAARRPAGPSAARAGRPATGSSSTSRASRCCASASACGSSRTCRRASEPQRITRRALAWPQRRRVGWAP